MIHLLLIALLQASMGDVSAAPVAPPTEVSAPSTADAPAATPPAEAPAAEAPAAATDAAPATDAAAAAAAPEAPAAATEQAAQEQPRRRCRREHVTGSTRPVRVCD